MVDQFFSTSHFPQITLLEDNPTIVADLLSTIQSDSKIGKNGDLVINQFSTLAEIDTLIAQGRSHGLFFIDIRLAHDKDRDGIDAIKKLRAANKQSKIVVYSGYDTEEEAAKRAGADQFVPKGGGSTYQNSMAKIIEIVDSMDWRLITNFPCLVEEVFNDFVILLCLLGRTADGLPILKKKKFPNHSFLKTLGEIYIGKPVIMNIFEFEQHLVFRVDDGAGIVDISTFEIPFDWSKYSNPNINNPI
jgi:CheY-like chemotaxis protein